ncbi:protocadherin Fat 2, partial [Clonorchis sinensis]
MILIFFLFCQCWITLVSIQTRFDRYSPGGLVQLSHTCVVYDETPGNRVLSDDLNGNPCSLLSPTQFTMDGDGVSVNTKIISTANPLAHYFSIQPINFTVVTTQRIDREKFCVKYASGSPDGGQSAGIIRCCANRRRDCDLSVTILVQLSRTQSRQQMNVSVDQLEKQSHFLRLSIRLVDINDNAPRFQAPTKQLFVSEGIKVGTRLQLPLAEDADSEDYGIVRYYLHSQNDDTFELVQ